MKRHERFATSVLALGKRIGTDVTSDTRLVFRERTIRVSLEEQIAEMDIDGRGYRRRYCNSSARWFASI